MFWSCKSRFVQSSESHFLSFASFCLLLRVATETQCQKMWMSPELHLINQYLMKKVTVLNSRCWCRNIRWSFSLLGCQNLWKAVSLLSFKPRYLVASLWWAAKTSSLCFDKKEKSVNLDIGVQPQKYNKSVEFIFTNSSWYNWFTHSVTGLLVNWIHECFPQRLKTCTTKAKGPQSRTYFFMSWEVASKYWGAREVKD